MSAAVADVHAITRAPARKRRRTPVSELEGPCVVYYRVSTEHQRAGHGLAAQADAAARLAADRGLEVTAFCWDVESGRTARRPGLELALTLLVDGGARTLVVPKLDRLARSARDVMVIAEFLEDHGFGLVVGNMPDLHGPFGKLMRSVGAAFAELEAELASERTREALAAARAKGVRVGRPPGQFLVPAETRARVRELRARGYSLRRVAAELNAEGVPAGRGGRWHPESVRLVCR